MKSNIPSGDSFVGRGQSLLGIDYLAAIASISTSAPSGILATSTQMRAGIMCELSLSCCDLEGLSVYPVIPFGSRTLGIVSRDRRFLTPVAKQFMICVQDAFA